MRYTERSVSYTRALKMSMDSSSRNASMKMTSDEAVKASAIRDARPIRWLTLSTRKMRDRRNVRRICSTVLWVHSCSVLFPEQARHCPLKVLSLARESR